MRKKFLQITALFLAAALSGCAQTEPVQVEMTEFKAASTTATTTTTTTTATTTATFDIAEILPEQTQSEEIVSTSAVTSETVSEQKKTPLKVGGRDFFNTETTYYFAEDALDSGNEFYYEFDYTYGFLASGVYDDSFRSPEKFDLEDFLYTPDKEYDKPDEFIRISAGKTVGNAKIKSAFSSLTKEGDEGESYIWITEALLDGEYELTGVCTYYYIEEYGASSGDMFFIPDESIAGFPLVCGFSAGASFNGGVGAYSEVPRGLYIGNLFNAGNRSDNITLGDDVLKNLNGIFGSETENCTKKVKVKLSDIKLSWNDQIGTSLSRAVPLSAREIK